MKVYLRDRNEPLTKWWDAIFENEPNVEVSTGDIFDEGEHMTADAIVSPANSFGFMDGGIDYVYSDFLGWGMSEDLRKIIWTQHQGELLVGQAVTVDIHESNPDSPFEFLISAPTMRTPMPVPNTVNAYLAFVAALREADKHPGINSILCPGLATSIGKMPPDVCAIQMHAAWTRYNKPKHFDVLGVAHIDHHSLLSPDAYLMKLKAHG